MTTMLIYNSIDLLLMAAAFGLVFCVWFIVVLVWHARKQAISEKIQRRLGLIEERGSGRVLRLWHDGKEVVTTVPWLRYRMTVSGHMMRFRKEAGLKMSPSKVILAVIGLSVAAFVFGYGMSGKMIIGLGGLAAVPIGCWIYMERRIRLRLNLMERQLIDAMDLASRSLRAGHPLNGAFRLISEEIDPPIKDIFTEIVQQTELGVSLEQAIREAAAKSSSQDLKLFASSVSIQMKTGGNLADMMERLAMVIRDRIRLGRRVKVLTAQTQLSKRILIALPIVIFALLNVLNPGYMGPLYSTVMGRIMLITTCCMLLLGAWIMNRLSILRF